MINQDVKEPIWKLNMYFEEKSITLKKEKRTVIVVLIVVLMLLSR